jgi:hypothetical protein
MKQKAGSLKNKQDWHIPGKSDENEEGKNPNQ